MIEATCKLRQILTRALEIYAKLTDLGNGFGQIEHLQLLFRDAFFVGENILDFFQHLLLYFGVNREKMQSIRHRRRRCIETTHNECGHVIANVLPREKSVAVHLDHDIDEALPELVVVIEGFQLRIDDLEN